MFPSLGPDAPAWVQAIGSVAAIICAIWISRYSTEHHDREAEKIKEQEQLNRVSLNAQFSTFIYTQIAYSKYEFDLVVKLSEHRATDFEREGLEYSTAFLNSQIISSLKQDVLEPLMRISTIDIERWPDPELAHIYFRAFQKYRFEIESIINRFSDPNAPYYATWPQISEINKALITPGIAKFDYCNQHLEEEINQANILKVDVRYPNRKRVDDQIAKDAERRQQEILNSYAGYTREELENMNDELDEQERTRLKNHRGPDFRDQLS